MSEARQQIAVSVVQRALAVAHREFRTMPVPSPGAVDGLWGPRSATAWDAWAAAEQIPTADRQYDVLVDMSSGARRDFLSVTALAARRLALLAEQYRAPAQAPTAPAPAPVAPTSRASAPWMAIGIGLATLSVVGLGFYLVRRKRRRRR